jgi:hypothetical protein
MTKLQSQRTRSELKALFGLLLAVILAGAFAVAGQARPADSSRQHGALHVTKECSPPPEGGFTGEAGSYCTIKSSNLKPIGVGSKVFYAEAAGAAGLGGEAPRQESAESYGRGAEEGAAVEVHGVTLVSYCVLFLIANYVQYWHTCLRLFSPKTTGV